MSYTSRETSEYSGEPRELFWFMQGTDSWTYTTEANPREFESLTFEPIAGLKRSNIKTGGEASARQLTVELPLDNELGQNFIRVSKIEPVWLYIYRIHDGETDFRIYWQGRVRGAEVKGNQITVTLDSILLSTKVSALRHLYQGQCNHFTYDANCALSEVSYSATVEIETVDGSVLTFIDPRPAGYFRAGQIRKSNGDRRFIVSDTESGGTHTVELLSPFEDLVATDEVTAVGGACLHTFDTCQTTVTIDGDTVDNSDNYGGYPKVPRKNPFKSIH